MKPGKVVRDFLPGPETLQFKEQVVTLRLGESTVQKELTSYKTGQIISSLQQSSFSLPLPE